MRRNLIALFIASSSLASVAACVGDDPTFDTDGGGGNQNDATAGNDASQGGGDGSPVSDSSSGNDGSSTIDSGVDAGPVCGYGGEACCALPLAACNQGLACVSNVCRANDIWVVGSYLEGFLGPNAGISLHYDGTSWTKGPTIPLGTADNYNPSAVWSFSPTSYVTITTEGKADEYLPGPPASWRQCGTVACADPGTTQQLEAIYGFGSDDYWIAGSNVMYHCSLGASCVSTTTGLPGSWGQGTFSGTSSNDLWYSQFTSVFHYNGTAWTVMSGRHAYTLWEHTPTDVWSADTEIQHYDGTTWTTFAFTQPDGGAPGNIYTMGGSAGDDVWALGSSSGHAFGGHWNGASWTYYPLPASFTYTPNAVLVISKVEAYAVAFSSPIAKWDGTSWTAVTMPQFDAGAAETTGNWYGIATSGRPRP